MNRDGSGARHVTCTSGATNALDWQPIPFNAYPRPKGASPVRVSLVTAYDAVHGAEPHPRPAARLPAPATRRRGPRTT